MREYGSEFDLELGDRIFQRLSMRVATFLTFRSCRDACTALAARLKQNGILTVLFPALCCESMYIPFKNQGLAVRFHDIDRAFRPILPKYLPPNCALFCMNYYGVNRHKEFIRTVKETNPYLPVVLDLTHVPYDELWFTEGADYYVASLRKTIPVINGGLLVATEEEWRKFPYVRNEFTELRREGMKKKFQYLHSKNADMKKSFRSVLKNAEIALGMGCEAIGADEESTEYIKNLDVSGIRVARRENYARLYAAVENIQNIKCYTPKNLAYTPFSLPIYFINQQQAQKRMASLGIFAPILWPLSDECREKSDFATEFEQHALSLPIDQRYDSDDMDEIAQIIRSIA